MKDSCGREINYLRLSVTDECNLCCSYCRRAGEKGAPLSDAETLRLVRVAAGLGISSIRITGGEPLLRAGLESLVANIRGISGITDIALTTNGTLLAAKAKALAAAGLKRVNISLDTLDPEKFARLTGKALLADALRAIDAALEAGLSPVKINFVALRGINDDEIAAFAKLTLNKPLHVRFIELMPLGCAPGLHVPLHEIKTACGAIEPAADAAPDGAGPAQYMKLPGAQGTIGFIAALSSPFCSGCNRLRLTSRGILLPCLADPSGTDIAAALRGGESDAELAELFAAAARSKKAGHHMATDKNADGVCMCSIGG